MLFYRLAYVSCVESDSTMLSLRVKPYAAIISIQLRQHGPLETAYRTHLSAALGYYQHLLLRLQREFRLCLSGVLDFHLMPDIRSPPGGISYKMWTSAAQEWAHQACHRCLICLGDIGEGVCVLSHCCALTSW